MTAGPLEALMAARLTFGRTPALDAELAAVGGESWLAAQLDPSSVADPDLDAMLSGYTTLTATNAANRSLLDAVDGRLRVTRELSHATFLRMVYSRRQVHEVLVDFWSNHLNISLFAKDAFCVLKTQDDREVVRPHALGRFADLLSASAHSPAMLVYLDNYRNDARDASHVNQNYGRELLELHTLGILDGAQVYSEDDVVAVARVLSGWSTAEVAGVGTQFRFRAEYHDPGPASILGGAWSTPGRAGAAGYEDGVSLIDFLAHHPSTAQHLAWKLCRRFVSDVPPPELVASAARVYLDQDTAIGPVIEHIVRSPAFLAGAGVKLRRGLDVVVAAFRLVGASVDPDPLGAASTELHAGNGMLARLGQRLFSHDPPDGYPDEKVDWVSADGLLRRWELGGRLANNGFAGVTTDVPALFPTPVPTTAGEFLDRLAPRLLGGLSVPPAGFSDVPASAPVAAGVDWAAGAGVIRGYPDGTFRPRNPVTRGQVVAMLWAAVGRPAGSPAHGLTDVPARAPYAGALDWAKAQGVVTGYADGTFRPRNPVDRGQLAVMLFNLYGAPQVALTDAERSRILPFLGGADATVDDGFLRTVAPDLIGILLSLPRFQYR